MEKDYSQKEVNNIIDELQDVYFTKLKTEELYFLTVIKGKKINQEQRDKLIKLYDAVSEVE